jgi:hypothetical protein
MWPPGYSNPFRIRTRFLQNQAMTQCDVVGNEKLSRGLSRAAVWAWLLQKGGMRGDCCAPLLGGLIDVRALALSCTVRRLSPVSLKTSAINSTMVLSLAKTRIAPMRGMAVLTIANRLGANQALSDMVERIARVLPEIREVARMFSTSIAQISIIANDPLISFESVPPTPGRGEGRCITE